MNNCSQQDKSNYEPKKNFLNINHIIIKLIHWSLLIRAYYNVNGILIPNDKVGSVSRYGFFSNRHEIYDTCRTSLHFLLVILINESVSAITFH